MTPTMLVVPEFSLAVQQHFIRQWGPEKTLPKMLMGGLGLEMVGGDVFMELPNKEGKSSR